MAVQGDSQTQRDSGNRRSGNNTDGLASFGRWTLRDEVAARRLVSAKLDLIGEIVDALSSAEAAAGQ